MKKNEIGSEFWDVPIGPVKNHFFSIVNQWYLCGRSALQAIVKDLDNVDTIALPSWCCHTMIKPFVDAGISVRFYPVYYDKVLVQKLRYDCDALYVMDYFGYTCIQQELSEYKGIIIRDVTHSIFSAVYSDADYYFGSLRKWFGVWTGGYAWSKDGHILPNGELDKDYIEMRKIGMQLKKEYISGFQNEKDYLAVFNNAEEYLEKVGISAGLESDIELAETIDVKTLVTSRRMNAEILRHEFFDWLIFPEMSSSDCPLFVPVSVPLGKRDKLKQYLIEHDIYCPVHWPVSLYHKLDEKTRIIYENELSLVCDQRYTENDMDRMVETIKSFWKETV